MRRSLTAATKLEPKSRIEIAAVVFSATSEARNRAANAADSRKFFFAIRTTINVTLWKTFRGERQIVTARFVGDSQIATRLSPFCAMRRDPSSADPPLREQMRQLVSKRPIDLVRAGLAVNRSEIVIK
jgi:hypothetical protein